MCRGRACRVPARRVLPPLDMRKALHRGIRWMTAKLERADELVDSHPVVALETAVGMLRYLGRMLGTTGATDARSNLN